MLYNYHLEVAALFFLTCIFIHYLLHRQLPLERTKVFFFYMLTGMIAMAANIASCIGCEHLDTVPVWLNYVFAQILYIVEAVNLFLFYYYTLLLCNRDRTWRIRSLIIGVVPIAAFLAVVLSTPFTGWFYTFDAVRGFCTGPLGSVGYVMILAYTFAELLLVILNRGYMRRSNRIIVILYFVMMLASFGMQLFHRNLLLDGIVRCVVVVFLYVSMQNPGSLLDGGSGRYNGMALRIMVHDRISRQQKFTVVYIYLNKFSNISSVIGYENVDALAAQIGFFLAEIVGEENTYRTEFSSFALILPDDRQTVETAVEKIRNRFTQTWCVGNQELLFETNITVAASPEHFSSVLEMNALRDYMMEQAKLKGTNTLVVADEKIKQEFARQCMVEKAIRRTLSENGIDVYFQPIYSVREQKLVAAEALARMKDEELGNIPPNEFIPIAEKNGTIIELGRQIFEKCCAFIKNELVPHPELGIRSIHINLSVVQCIQSDMAEQLLRIIDEYQVPPGMLNLELTERITLSATDLMRAHMQKLTACGVKFSLDDYGTGSSNCAYLIDYAFPMVKFDKKMMDSYFESETAHLILGGEFETLKKLGIDIVAEGIETEEQVKRLKEMDMTYIQGYYFAKPLPAGEFLKLVREKNINKGTEQENG